MSYHTPQYFVKDYAMSLFFLVDGTIVKAENNHTITTTMDLTTMGPMQIWPLSDLHKNHSGRINKGDVLEKNGNFTVFNPDRLDVPIAMGYHDDLEAFHTNVTDNGWEYVGNIDLHLFNVPRHIRSEQELNKFLPNYAAWFRNLGIHNQSAIDQGTASKVNHIIRRLLLSPEEIQDSFWFKREFARHFAPATFKTQRTFPSFCTEDFFISNEEAPLTFPHYSAKEPGQVAFSPIDINYKEADRQVRTKPGRYLNKFLDLDSDQVRKCVAIENGDQTVQLKFAKTIKEFTNVYLRGPSSCMSHPIDWYDGSASTGRLPVSILANGDIEVAYIELPNGLIPARSLVVQSTQSYVEIYHNTDAMDNARSELRSRLEDAGFTYNSYALVGQTIERIPVGDGESFVCPYIDSGNLPVDDMDDCLLICEENYGEMTANYQTGVCQSCKETCANCEQDHDSEATYVDDVGDVCERCLDNDFVHAYCGNSHDRYIHHEDAIFIDSMGEWYRHTDNTLQFYSIYKCHITDEYYHTDDLVTCDVSDEYIHQDEASYIGNGLHVSHEYAVHSDHLGHYLIEEDAELITMDDGTTDWFPDDEVVYSKYHQQSIPTCLASEINGDYYWTSHLVCDEVGNYSLLETTTPITLETAA
jgi:hypothetical protein